MRHKINTLKEQYRVSEGVINKYEKELRIKNNNIQILEEDKEHLQKRIKEIGEELTNKGEQIEFQKSQVSYLESRLASLELKPPQN